MEMLERQLLQHTDKINNLLARYGVKFGIYKNNVFREQLFPFDSIPRIIEHTEFEMLERGLKQRVLALNLFLKDIYSEKKIVRDGIVPEDFIFASSGYMAECEGVMPVKGIYSHISGIDLVKGKDFVFELYKWNEEGTCWILQEGITDLFKKGWTASGKGSYIVFKVTGSCIGIQYRRTIQKPAPVAKVTIDSDPSKEFVLDANFDEDWGDCLYLQTVLDSSVKEDHSLDIEIVSSTKEDKSSFYLVSIITA